MENFRPRARLLKLLGEELIGSQHLAIFELIKNAYDADADDVLINISNVNDVTATTISIKDNGCGMTLDTIKNSWLEPGTDAKEKMLENRIYTKKYHRLPLGSKGVGRFAAYKLGNVVTLYTKTLSDGEFKVTVDLNEAISKKYLNEFFINIENVSGDDSHIETSTGTEIIISSITKPLTLKSILNLNKQILSIQSPFEYFGYKSKKIKNPINIQLGCPEFQDKIKETSINDLIDSSLYRFRFQFINGRLEYEYKFTPNKKLQESTKLEPRMLKEVLENITTLDKHEPVKMPVYYEGLRRICGSFYCYDFDSKTIQYYQNKQALRTYTLENSGIRVYRGGMRIYNYGETGDDWLELDQERIDDPSRNLSNRLIIGAIELEPQTASYLREKTNREGFIDDEAYQKLKLVVKSILSIFNKERLTDKDKLRLITNDNYKEVITNMQEPIAELRFVARNFNAPNEVFKKIEKVEKAYNQMRDIMLSSGLKGLNTAIALHEIEKTLRRLKRAIENKDTTLMKKEISMALALIDGVGDLLKKDPIRKYKASVLIRDVITLSEDRFKRHNISIDCPILDNKNSDFDINVPKRMIQSSLMNLIDNSVYWLSVRWYKDEDVGKKKIYINAEYIDGLPAIIIKDNGIGFPKGDREELFKPFVTTKPMGVGMGLGLYYVKTAMDAIGGEVSIMERCNKFDSDGASIALIFKN